MTTNSIKNVIHGAITHLFRKEFAVILLVILVAATTALGQHAPAVELPSAPVPIISAVSPVSAVSGGDNFQMIVLGSNFVNGCTVQWNGAALPTTFDGTDTLLAMVDSSMIAIGGTARITVSNPAILPPVSPASGRPATPLPATTISNVFYFPVNAPIATLADAKFSIVAGAAPFGMAAADFDGDGKLDLAVANDNDDTVSVLLGNGDGTFKAQTTFATVVGPFGIAAGDLNGDGHADLVVGSNGGQGLTIALGDGTGAFTVTTLTASGCLAYPVLADVNGDGNLDIVVGNECGNGIDIFLGDGLGGFGAPTSIGTGVSDVYQLVVADFNGDGMLDIASASSSGSNVYVYLGDGMGGFSSGTSYSAVSGAWAIATGDFDGDSNLDLVVTSISGGGFAILLGDGAGGFGKADVIRNSGSFRAVAVGDLDDDGNLDIVTSANPGGVVVWLGDGEGSISDDLPIAAGNGNYGIALANFATVGTLDIATTTGSGVKVLVPTISLAPTSVDLGSVDIGSSAQQIFTLTNSTPIAVEITSVSLGAAGEDGYTQTNNCGSSELAPGATCSVTVTFAPLESGSTSAQLVVSDSAPGGTQSANLAGSGVGGPVATLSTGSLTFPNQNLGVGSTAMPVTLTNTGADPLTGLAVSIIGTNSADFTQTNNCQATLAVNHVCTVNVTFTPSALGARSASLQFTDNASNTPQLVTLTGTGVQIAQQLLYIDAPPATLTAGGNIGVITVGVYTMQSVLITSSNAEIRVTINGPNLFFHGISESAVSGVATFDFSAVPLDAAGQYTITAAIDNSVQSKGRRVVRAGGGGVAPAIATTLVTAQNSSIQMNVSGYPSPTFTGFAHTFTVSVTDVFLNPITTYTGTVTLSSSDQAAVLTPSPYTFVSGDMGTHTFTGALNTVGTQSISATDGQNELSGSQTGIVVNSAPHFIVNTLADDSGTAVCDGDEPCSFRSAITASNTAGEGLITVDTSQFQGSGPFTATLTNGVLELTGNISITGPAGFPFMTISGGSASAIFLVDSGAVVTISTFAIGHGSSTSDGGAISNAGTLTLTNLLILSNNTLTNGGAIANTGTLTIANSGIGESSAGGNGGGITNSGTLTITNSSVSNATATLNGGGIFSGGTLTVNSSTIGFNTATVNGGGASTTGTAVFYDSTINGNAATGNGGGIDNNGSLSIPQSTIFGNTAADGSAIENEASGTIELLQCTVTQNDTTTQEGGTIKNLNDNGSAVTLLNSIDSGNNTMAGDCLGCGTQSSFNVLNVAAENLGLGALGTNGGPTQTVMPQAGSQVIGAGSVALIAAADLPQSFVDDQRGTGFPRVVNNMVDLGAVQTQPGPAATALLLVVDDSSVAGQPLSVTVTAVTQCNDPATSFTDTVHFTSSDPLAVLPADYTFVGGDAGVHVFSVTLKTSGTETLTVTDIQHPSLTATQTIADAAAAASTIIAVAGSGQTATPGSAFAIALAAKVTDAFGNPIPAIPVTFTAPTTGASGTFAGGVSTLTISTLSTGVATATTFTANGTAGQYTVTAGASSQPAVTGKTTLRPAETSLTPASFTLTNGVPPSYTVTADPPTLTIVQGQSGTTVLTFTPVGGFTGTVSLTCSGLPADSDCVFVPAQAVMTGNNQVVDVTLTVNTTGTNGQLSQLWQGTHRGPDAGRYNAKLAALFGTLLAIAILGWTSRRAKRPRYAMATFALLLVLAGVGLAACTHSHATTTAGTVPGTYPVNVTASVGTGATQTAVVTITIVKE